jgi:acetylornithine/succinyldiaminopimelate/putrescine aminotransferase
MELDYKKYFLELIAQTSPEPLLFEVERAEGLYLYDKNETAYIDLISGISVNNVGHRHPHIIEAIKKQLDRYLHTMVFGEHVQDIQVKLAKRILSHLPFEQGAVYFVNSGSEAIEGALKLAKKATGRHEIIAARNAYHGSTHGALSLMSHTYYNQAFRPLLPGITFIDFNVEEEINAITENTAAVVLETVQGEAGYMPATSQFIHAIADKCKSTGTLLILDEVQCGFGRTGKFFAFQHYNITPDIVVMAKGMGGGMPIGAFSAAKETMLHLSDNPILGHITTFGGHPVSCAASLATIEVIEEEQLMEQIESKEALFRRLLQHAKINRITGKGLMLALHLDSFDQVKNIIQYCIQKRLITDWFLYATNCVRISPPLTITESQIIEVCTILIEALEFELD